MHCILPEYRLSKERYEELWKNCIFVLDTSVIFNIYRYSPGLRNEVKDVLDKISHRLWIPYQVAYEYHDNISSVISNEIDKYNAIIKYVASIQKPNKGEINKDLRRKHSSSSEILKDLDEKIENLEKGFDDEFKKIEKYIREKVEDYPKRKDLEDINDIISSLFDGKIGRPYSIAELEQVSDKGAKRYNLLLPPGYEDKKDKNGIKIYGDLIVWFQIIDMAKEKKTPVIFICDDLKEDWWWSPSDTNIGPRPELIQEFSHETKELFWMYSLDRFLKYAHKYINLEVKEEAIEEAKEYRIHEEERIKEIELLENFMQVSIDSEALGNIAQTAASQAGIKLSEIQRYPEKSSKAMQVALQAACIDPKIIERYAQAGIQAACFYPKIIERYAEILKREDLAIQKESDTRKDYQSNSDNAEE